MTEQGKDGKVDSQYGFQAMGKISKKPLVHWLRSYFPKKIDPVVYQGVRATFISLTAKFEKLQLVVTKYWPRISCVQEDKLQDLKEHGLAKYNATNGFGFASAAILAATDKVPGTGGALVDSATKPLGYTDTLPV